MARTWTSRPPGSRAVRCDLAAAVHAKVRVLAEQAGVAMSAFARLALELLAEGRTPSVEAIRQRAGRLRAARAPPAKGQARKGKGG